MSYTKFASVYDRLIQDDIDYPGICTRIKELFTEYRIEPEIVCDLAAGTGSISIPLALDGYDIISVDKSPEMLNIARDKAGQAGTDILFLCQSIENLDLYGSADAFLCVTDGFNYIIEPKKLEQALKRINTCFLNPGGVLIFDISSRYKLENTLGNNTFTYDDGNIYYIWRNKFNKKSGLSFLDLTFFERHGSMYKRFCETQIQKGYTRENIISMLKKSGYECIRAYDGYSHAPARPESERIVFSCRKPLN